MKVITADGWPQERGAGQETRPADDEEGARMYVKLHAVYGVWIVQN